MVTIFIIIPLISNTTVLIAINTNMPRKYKKKVNKLKIKECEAILANVSKQTDSQYYNHVYKQYSRLLLEKENNES